ncbi:DegT/DnrJ/EryC1/StrS family aminotransferase [Candidatus Woesearchaeota archaeon]|nr:DegT/DnrJ/EryC1/StrS family aminotransferase [Candidatus Woesearchaeota archaeon]
MISRVGPETSMFELALALLSSFKKEGVRLEEELSKFFRAKRALILPSGRAALYYILRSLPQKDVFLPAFNCRAVVEAVKLAKKTIHYVDVNMTDYNMDVRDLRRRIVPNSIVVATHQFGIPCDLDSIQRICRENNCTMIEDNAAAFGAKYKGRLTGTFGKAAIASFENTKTITASRGGAALFQDISLYRKAKKIYENEKIRQKLLTRIIKIVQLAIYLVSTNHTFYRLVIIPYLKRKGYYGDKGKLKVAKTPILYCEEMSGFQIKLALFQLRRVGKIIHRRTKIAEKYREALARIKSVSVYSGEIGKNPSFMRYPLLVKRGRKMDFYLAVLSHGVDLGFSFSYVCGNSVNYKYATKISEQILNLPIRSTLSDDEVDKIIEAIRMACEETK